jgi:hypothetical protein
MAFADEGMLTTFLETQDESSFNDAGFHPAELSWQSR